MIDIGINLTHDSFDHDRDRLIQTAREHGIHHLVVTGTSLTQRAAVSQLQHQYPDYLSTTAGIHPHHSNELGDEASLEALAAWSRQPEVVAVGECGLDYFRMFQDKHTQIQCFEKHIALSLEVNKPLFLHVRDAHEDFLAILKAAGRALPGVVHCFTGSESELEDYLAMGFYIGLTGWICDERRGSNILDFLAKIPDDRLMIETDAPYLLPRTLRPKPQDRRNEPRYLGEIARTIAAATRRPLEEIIEITDNNAQRFFRLRVTIDNKLEFINVNN